MEKTPTTEERKGSAEAADEQRARGSAAGKTLSSETEVGPKGQAGLHWFDKVFHGSQGPARWAKAKLVRYADDFVVLARYLTPNLRGYIEEKLETWMGLEINREKTRVVDLNEKQAHLDFLGYTFRYDRDRKGRGHRYLNLVPSKKALQRERNRLREMTGYSQSHKPLPRLIGGAESTPERLGRLLLVWAPAWGLREDQQLRTVPPLSSCGTEKPATLSPTSRENPHAAFSAHGPEVINGPSVSACVCLRSETFRRAG